MYKMQTFSSKVKGSVRISGSKNATLPIIVAALLNKGRTYLKNIPKITDVDNLLAVIKKIGCRVKFKSHHVLIESDLKYQDLLFEELKKFRASYYFMGLFLALFKEVKIYAPGGCQIGNRPINYHLEGFKLAGVDVVEDNQIVHLKANKLQPFTYSLPKKSLGATVNLLLLASKIDGISTIENASTEPEVDDLINFMNFLNIKVIRFQNMIIIEGKKQINLNVSYSVMPDRIEAMTYLMLGVFSERIKIKQINLLHLEKPLMLLKQSGLNCKFGRRQIIVYRSRLKPIQLISGDYPEISTDQMPLFYPIYSRMEGVSYFTEMIFDNRFHVVKELQKTNADIIVIDKTVCITGKNNLIGNDLVATDLRAAASLLLEAIINGDSTVTNLFYLERGYDDIYNKLRKLGVVFKVIKRV